MTPVIILLALTLLSLGFGMSSHGKYTRHNFWGQLIGVIINLALLYWAGLFDVFFK